MGRPRTRSHSKRHRDSGVIDRGKASFSRRVSGQHAANPQDLPSPAECTRLGEPTSAAGAVAGSESTHCSTQFKTRQGPAGDFKDNIRTRADDSPSSSSDLSKNLRGKKRARKSLASGVKEEVDAAHSLQEENQVQGDRRNTQARGVRNIRPVCRHCFGSVITNRGLLGRLQKNGPGNADGEALEIPDQKMVSQESTQAHPVKTEVGVKASCGRDACGLVSGADGEACSKYSPGTVHSEYERLCVACHRPSSNWTHFSLEFLPRANRCLKESAKHGVALPKEVLKGCRPSTDCLCTRLDCISHFVRMKERTDRLKRSSCAVCKAPHEPRSRPLRCENVADAITFFTTGMGAKRRDSTVLCTRNWLAEDTMLCPACSMVFSRHRHHSNASVSEVTTADIDRYRSNAPVSDVTTADMDRHRSNAPASEVTTSDIDRHRSNAPVSDVTTADIDRHRSNAPVSEVITADIDRHHSDAPVSEITTVDINRRPASQANNHAEAEIRRRLNLGLVVTVDEAHGILVRERQELKLKGADAYEKKLARGVLRKMCEEIGGPHTTTSPLAVVPKQVSPEYAAEIFAELYRTRWELRLQEAEVERLKSI